MTVKNQKEFINKMKKRLGPEAEQKIRKALTRAVLLVDGRVKESIARDPKTGETYQKYNPRRSHTASAPGEPPATDTGFLISSISNTVDVEAGDLVGKIIVSAPYAASLEFGTLNMAPRPYLQPALNENAEKINEIFKTEGLIK